DGGVVGRDAHDQRTVPLDAVHVGPVGIRRDPPYVRLPFRKPGEQEVGETPAVPLGPAAYFLPPRPRLAGRPWSVRVAVPRIGHRSLLPVRVSRDEAAAYRAAPGAAVLNHPKLAIAEGGEALRDACRKALVPRRALLLNDRVALFASRKACLPPCCAELQQT